MFGKYLLLILRCGKCGRVVAKEKYDTKKREVVEWETTCDKCKERRHEMQTKQSGG